MTMNNSITRFEWIAGVDVSDRKSSVFLVHRSRGVFTEQEIATTSEGFEEFFRDRDPVRVIIEVGSHSPWIVRVLRNLGHQVVVADPRQILLISRSISKTDRKDAELLARLGRGDLQLLHPVVHRSRQTMADRAVVSARSRLVECRTKLLNAARGLVKPFGFRFPSGSPKKLSEVAMESLPEDLHPAILPLLEQIHSLSAQIKKMDAVIGAISLSRYPVAGRLAEVPGVGPITSLHFVLTIEDPTRFKRSRDVGPYLGLTPKQYASGDRSPQLGITRRGDRCLRQLLVQCAHYILSTRGPDSDLRRWGLRIACHGGRRGKRRAVVAVARRLAVLLHRIWTTGEEYRPIADSKDLEEETTPVAAQAG